MAIGAGFTEARARETLKVSARKIAKIAEIV